MSLPSIRSGRLFWGMQALPLPDMLLLLYRGAASDRLRRIRYRDIRQVVATTVFPPFAAVCAMFFLMFGATCIAAWDAVWAGLFFVLPSLYCLLLCFVRRRTVIDILTDAGSVRISKLWLSPRKRAAFLDALTAGIQRDGNDPS